jgi:hypothetical protein
VGTVAGFVALSVVDATTSVKPRLETAGAARAASANETISRGLLVNQEKLKP